VSRTSPTHLYFGKVRCPSGFHRCGHAVRFRVGRLRRPPIVPKGPFKGQRRSGRDLSAVPASDDAPDRRLRRGANCPVSHRRLYGRNTTRGSMASPQSTTTSFQETSPSAVPSASLIGLASLPTSTSRSTVLLPAHHLFCLHSLRRRSVSPASTGLWH